MIRLTLLLILISNSCSSQSGKFKDIKYFGYQLQNYTGDYSLNRIKKSKDSVWVIDYSKDGSDNNRWAASQINGLKGNNNKIISYFSIGEAESYRYYFKSMDKKLILNENKNWEGNFKVKYWTKKWYKILYAYLDKIVAAGFDGVYLDIVDAFEYFKDQGPKAQKMVNLIVSLAQKARKKNPNFIMIVQNGSPIIRQAKDIDKFWNAIDGIGVEDVFYFGEKEMNNPLKIQKSVLKELDQFLERDKIVLSVEYISEKKKIQQYWNLARRYKMIPVVAPRELNGPLKFPHPAKRDQ